MPDIEPHKPRGDANRNAQMDTFLGPNGAWPKLDKARTALWTVLNESLHPKNAGPAAPLLPLATGLTEEESQNILLGGFSIKGEIDNGLATVLSHAAGKYERGSMTDEFRDRTLHTLTTILDEPSQLGRHELGEKIGVTAHGKQETKGEALQRSIKDIKTWVSRNEQSLSQSQQADIYQALEKYGQAAHDILHQVNMTKKLLKVSEKEAVKYDQAELTRRTFQFTAQNGPWLKLEASKESLTTLLKQAGQADGLVAHRSELTAAESQTMLLGAGSLQNELENGIATAIDNNPVADAGRKTMESYIQGVVSSFEQPSDISKHPAGQKMRLESETKRQALGRLADDITIWTVFNRGNIPAETYNAIVAEVGKYREALKQTLEYVDYAHGYFEQLSKPTQRGI